MNESISDIYWAKKPSDDCVKEILDKVDTYYLYLRSCGRLALWRMSWLYYYRARSTGGSLNKAGINNQFTTMAVNNYKNLLSHVEAITTQQRVAFEPKATNSDHSSQSQVILARTLLDYYMREKKLDDNFSTAVKTCLIFGEAYVTVAWDFDIGNEHGLKEDGKTPAKNGDVKYTNFDPFNVIKDYTNTSSNSDQYYILRTFENKHDIIATQPEDKWDDILSSSTDMAVMQDTIICDYSINDSEKAVVYTLLHERTPALPAGRLLRCLDNGTVLEDGPLPYERTHVYRISQDNEIGTNYGYTVGNDLMQIQQLFDVLNSTVVTNQTTFGVQNIAISRAANIGLPQMVGSLNLIEYDPDTRGGGAPTPLQLTQTAAEVFNYLQSVNGYMENISGINSVVRGNPDASLTSGVALALVQSQAIQFQQPLHKAYVTMIEDVGTGTINLLKVFASTPRIVEICGKSNFPLTRSFTGQDLSNISRVLVDMGSPMSRTAAGRLEIAQQLLNSGLIENPDQFLQVLNTGKLEPAIEGKQAQLLLIKGENEALAANMPVRVLKTDDHAKHILEHTCILSNPNIRTNPDDPIVLATMQHIMEHEAMMNDPFVQRLSAILHREVTPGPMPGDGGGIPGQGGPMDPMAGAPAQPNAPRPPEGTEPQAAAIIEQQAALNKPQQ
jgi:hypothetical protein